MNVHPLFTAILVALSLERGPYVYRRSSRFSCALPKAVDLNPKYHSSDTSAIIS